MRPWAVVRDGVYIGYYPTKGEALTALERLAGRELRDSYNYTVEQVHACWRAGHFPTLTQKGPEMYRTTRGSGWSPATAATARRRTSAAGTTCGRWRSWASAP